MSILNTSNLLLFVCSVHDGKIGIDFSFSVDENHCHNNADVYSVPDLKARRKLMLASILCLLFMVAEGVGKCQKKSNILYGETFVYGPLSKVDTLSVVDVFEFLEL